MKRIKKLLCLVLTLILVCSSGMEAFAANITDNTTGKTTNKMITSSDGSNTYTLPIPKESKEVVIPVDITDNGIMFCYINPSDEKTTYEFLNNEPKPEIIAGLYKNQACQEADLIDSQTCEYLESIEMFGFYVKATKGEYYLKIKLNNYTMDSDTNIDIIPFTINTGSDREIKDYEPVISIALNNDPIYYKVKVNKRGLLLATILSAFDDQENDFTITLCDANKKEITKPENPQDNNSFVFYGVEKGEYYYKVKANSISENPVFVIVSATENFDFKSAHSKEKAITITLGKSFINGIQTVTTNKSDWFKFKVTKSKKVTVNFEALTNSGLFKVELYDAKNKKIKLTSTNKNSTYELGFKTNIYKYTTTQKLPKGTYYIKISKNNKFASGFYDISAK